MATAGKQNDVFKLISREVESLGFFGREGTCRSKDSVCVTKSARTSFRKSSKTNYISQRMSLSGLKKKKVHFKVTHSFS